MGILYRAEKGLIACTVSGTMVGVVTEGEVVGSVRLACVRAVASDIEP